MGIFVYGFRNGLDLCVRARDLDAMVRRQATLDFSSNPDAWVASGRFDDFVAINNLERPEHQIHTLCGTPALWIIDQYDHDLADWEQRGRLHLMHGCKESTTKSA